MKKRIVIALVLVGGLGLIVSVITAMAPLDFPHFSINSVSCKNCHFVHNTTEQFLNWAQGEPQNIDDTVANNLCLSCHDDVIAPLVKTHSSLTTDDVYGSWSIECRTCHWPHQQTQLRTYGNDSYLYSNTSSSISSTTLTQNVTNWTTNEYQGLVLVPNITNQDYNYKITSNTNDTLNISGAMDLDNVSVGDTFAIVYGKLIKSTISTPNSGDKTVRLFNATGNNSFADGDSTYDGVCEVCHTKPTHFRNDGGGSDQTHSLIGGRAGASCTEDCHKHIYGFIHGGGSSGGTGCVKCHGHNNKTLYDPDMSYPYSAGTQASTGRGNTTPHSTHTEVDADDLRGPGIYCDNCHNISIFPYFENGTDGNGDGKYNLSETTVCDTCHSPSGSYNGVNTVGSSVGAKDNWNSVGVYDIADPESLASGKEKWCGGCHDDNASVIQSVNASNVIGDEDASYTYGTGYGFYKTGHGLPTSETYPASGGVTLGAGRNCGDCHNLSTAHIDGNARTFDCTDGCDNSEYQQSYRLNNVSGQYPMNIPLTDTSPAISNDYYRLCFSCHAAEPFNDSSNMSTNLVTDSVNRHEYHLVVSDTKYPADYNYSGSYNSRISCVVCHNVHGTTKLTMVRDGKLIDRESGLNIWYNNDDIVSYSFSYPDPPVPETLPLSASTGTVWNPNSSNNLCSNCHSVDDNTNPEYRTPFQDVSLAPTLDWTGETNYTGDGVNPNSTEGSANFVFRIKYTDPNNDAPTSIQVWVDIDDSNSYESGEKYNMTDDDVGDTNRFDGKIYTKSLFIIYSGDGFLNYTFRANDSTADATGPPTNNSLINITTCSADTDGDYVCDATDNCPNNANSNQYDSDSDGVGDVCDSTPFIPAVAAGQWHSLVLKSDGTVWSFGNNAEGQLGDGTTTQRTTPVQVSGLENMTAIASGRWHSLAVADNGTVWSWGDDAYGQLGDDASLADQLTPVQVSGLTDIIAVIAGEYHSLALADDGTVWSWGRDYPDGQLGDSGDDAVDKPTPVQVVDQNDNRITGITAIAAGESHSLAVNSTGSVWGWGRYNEDQLGSGKSSINKRASQISGADNITAIGGGEFHSVFAQDNGTAWGLGRNADGQLGDGTTTTRTTPVQTSGLTNITAVVGGEIYTLALADNGTVWGYGDNLGGQLGVDTADIVSNAVQALDNNDAFLTDVIGIAAGNRHSIAVKSDGTIWVSGDNNYGQLGITQGFGSYTERFYEISALVDVPTLNWTGETNYVTDGVNPNSAVTGSNFVFRVNYSHVDEIAPTVIQVWVDEDDSNSYESGEKYSLTEADASDTNYTDGKIYNKTLTLTNAGSGTLNINYRFYATDGTYTATGTPTSDSVVTIQSATGFIGATPAVAAGQWHSLVLKKDGTVWAFGNNSQGQLGDGTTTQHTAPAQVSGLENMTTIAAGDYHSLALADNGTVWSWGDDAYGQLGDDASLADQLTPVQVSGLTDIIAVAAGQYYSLALADDGSVWSWGRDDEGQLGDSGTSPTDKPTPVQVVDQTNTGITGVTAIAAGKQHSLALNGSVLGWGAKDGYQIGVPARDHPTWYRASEIPDLENMTAIDGGNVHSVFAQDNGTAWGLGANGYGRLGDGTTAEAKTPVQTVGLINVSGVAAGNEFSLALISNGTVWGYGANGRGQLGVDQNPGTTSTPVWVLDNNNAYLTNVTAIAAGIVHSIAVKSDGTVWVSGDNTLGQLGITQDFGSYTERFYQISDFEVFYTPFLAWTGETDYTSDGVNPNSAVNDSDFDFRVNYTHGNNSAVPTVIQVWVDIDDSLSYESGEKYSLTEADASDTNYTDGKIYNKTLTLNYTDGSYIYRFYATDGTYDATGTPTSNKVVTVTAPPGAPPAGATPMVAGGEYFSLALLANGSVFAWGINTNGQLGDGTITTRTSPIQVPLINITAIAAGKEHSLALADNGTVWAWGYNNNGQLGDGTTTNHSIPAQVSGLENITAIAAGDYHSLALADNGTVWSWGDDAEGQLGDYGTSATDKSTPVQVVDQTNTGITEVTAIAAGDSHSLALNGSVLGWGHPWGGQIGADAQGWPVKFRASEIPDLQTDVSAIGGGYRHSVFVKNNDTAWGLGLNGNGQLGDGTETSTTTPVQTLGLIDVSRVAAGELHSLSLISNGTIWAYGYNKNCQLGIGSQDTSNHPNAEQTSSITDATAVATGDKHSLAVKNDGTVSFWAWGDNDYGQLGIGTISGYECTPQQVLIP